MKYSLDEFAEKNESVLNCIFAESGEDREMDFDLESAIERLYNNENNQYNLKYYLTPLDKLDEIKALLSNGNWTEAGEIYSKVNCSASEFSEWLTTLSSETIKDIALLGFYKN